jgi:NTP pyrophosphatase (non-canonical NTP hydrolase)
MDGKTTIKYLQSYIKSKDYNPDLKKDYFLKLSEEVGELAKAIRKDLQNNKSNSIKETIDEEIWDVIYYSLALANCYNIDVETVIKLKEEINNEKYQSKIKFEENR